MRFFYKDKSIDMMLKIKWYIFRSSEEKTWIGLRKRRITLLLVKFLKGNKKVLVSEEFINNKNDFLFNCGSFRIFHSTFTKRSDFKKIAAYAAFIKNMLNSLKFLLWLNSQSFFLDQLLREKVFYFLPKLLCGKMVFPKAYSGFESRDDMRTFSAPFQ